MYSKFFHENTDGVTQEWDFSFAGGYLSRDHVKVLFWPTGEFIGVPQEPAFTFLNDTRVRVTPAVPAGGTLEIRRVTPITQALVEFNDTSDFVEDNLNVMAQQAIYAVAELVDLYQDPNLTPTGVRALLMTGLLDNPLGVGTVTPAAKLEIVHTAGQVLNVTTSTDTDADIVVNRNSVESGRVRGVLNGLHVLGTSFVSMLANGVETLRVASTGALLNGKLTVNRGAGADAIEVQTDAGQDGHIDFRRGTSVVASLRSAFDGLTMNASQVIKFLINGVEYIRIDAAGRLGIGTTTPARPLHVVGQIRSTPTSTSEVGQVETVNDTGSALGVMRTGASGLTSPLFGLTQANRTLIYTTGSSDAGLVVGTQSNTPLHFGTNNATRMTLTADGNFGIGKTNPGARLNVAGGNILVDGTGVGLQLNNGQQYIVSNAEGTGITFGTAGTARYTIRSDGSFLSTGGLIGVATTAGADTSRLQVCSTDQANFARGGYLNLHGNNRATLPGCIQLVTGNAAGAYLSVHTADAVERLRVTDTGRLGIGTTSPSRALDVVGGIRSSVADSASIAQVETANDGGTSVATLRTGGSAATGTLLGQPNANRTFLFSSGGNDAGLVVGTQTNTPLHFGTSNATRMTLTASGLLGIGTTAAQRGLHLAGGSGSSLPSIRLERTSVRTFSLETANSGEFILLDNTAGSNRVTVDNSGNVGIGTSTPAVRLDVNGDINASSSLNVGFNRAADGAAVLDLQAQAGTGIDYNARLQRASGVDGQLTLTNAGAGGVVVQAEGAGLLNFRSGGSSRLELYSDGRVVFPGNNLRIATSRTIASATAAGSAGEIAWDANFIYICVATNTWRRTAHATW